MKRCSFDARSEGQSGDSLGEKVVMVPRRKQVALAWATGTSREIDCEAIGGRAGENICSGWAGEEAAAEEDH